MKKVISVILALTILFVSVSFETFAVNAAQNAPYMLSEKRTGKTLCKTNVYLSKKEGLTYESAKKSGSKTTLKKGSKFTIIGKDKKNGNRIYIKKKINGVTKYGYINSKNVCVITTKNCKVKSVKKYNPTYKKKIKYRYVKINGMPFYEFDQGKYPKKVINGLKVGYSCGPHTIAAALSALNGDIIFPETIMKKMSRKSLAPDLRGTSTREVIRSVKPYIKSNYNLNFEYESINRDQIFNYLKDGYMVICAVLNNDGLALFTKNAHFILLVGYDDVGNVVTFSSNKRVGFLDSYSESRIKGNFPEENIDEDIIAIKWKYDDSYTKLEKSVSASLNDDAKVSQHYYNYGKITKLKKDKKVTVLGKRGKTYYIKYTYSKKAQYAFINQKYITLS